MDDATLSHLLSLAVFTGVVHAAIGPDHYLPFIAMARAGDWTLRKALVVAGLCGVGHVVGSIVLGALGIVLGWALPGLEGFESHRGAIAAWLLIGLGVAYTAWGVRRAIRNRPHVHPHLHADGTVHAHSHDHHGEHAHVHTGEARAARMTPWVLFTVFVFGPCEPLIPQLMYPAAMGSPWGVVAVTLAFAAATIGTILVAVALGLYGVSLVRLHAMERYTHVLAGLAILACGAAMQLGL